MICTGSDSVGSCGSIYSFRMTEINQGHVSRTLAHRARYAGYARSPVLGVDRGLRQYMRSAKVVQSVSSNLNVQAHQITRVRISIPTF